MSIAVSCDDFDDLRTDAAVVKPAAGLEAVRFIGVVGVVGQQKLGQQRVRNLGQQRNLVTRTSVAPLEHLKNHKRMHTLPLSVPQYPLFTISHMAVL